MKINGIDIEQVTDLEKLDGMRATAYKAMEEKRDVFQKTKKWDKAEDEKAWKQANADYDALLKRSEQLRDSSEMAKRFEEIDQAEERLKDIEKRQHINQPPRNPEVTNETRELGLQAWTRRASGLKLTDEHQKACKALNFDPTVKDLEFDLTPTRKMKQLQRAMNACHESRALEAAERVFERRDLTTQTGSSGGNLIPEGFVPQLEIALLEYGGVLNVCDRIRTDSGNDLPWPSMNDTAQAGELIAENITATEQDPTFGVTTFGAYKLSSQFIQVPVELMQDSAFNLAQFLPQALGERLGRGMNSYGTTGTGSGEPNGCVTASTAGQTAASSTAIAYADLVGLEHSLDPAYRPRASYMFHDGVLELLRLLVDGESRPLWASGIQGGVPDRINGYTYQINQDMDAVPATTDKTVLFGDFSKFKCREVRGIRFRHLTERYAEFDQEAFLAFYRFDTDLVDAGTNPLMHLAMA